MKLCFTFQASFYIYCCSSSRFRKQLIHVIIHIYLNRCRKSANRFHNNRVVPQPIRTEGAPSIIDNIDHHQSLFLRNIFVSVCNFNICCDVLVYLFATHVRIRILMAQARSQLIIQYLPEILHGMIVFNMKIRFEQNGRLFKRTLFSALPSSLCFTFQDL